MLYYGENETIELLFLKRIWPDAFIEKVNDRERQIQGIDYIIHGSSSSSNINVDVKMQYYKSSLITYEFEDTRANYSGHEWGNPFADKKTDVLLWIHPHEGWALGWDFSTVLKNYSKKDNSDLLLEVPQFFRGSCIGVTKNLLLSPLELGTPNIVVGGMKGKYAPPKDPLKDNSRTWQIKFGSMNSMAEEFVSKFRNTPMKMGTNFILNKGKVPQRVIKTTAEKNTVAVRQITVNHKKPTPYSSLPMEYKKRYEWKVNTLFSFCEKHQGQIVSWKMVNKIIPHIYNWSFDSWNDYHNSTILYDDDGIVCI